MTGEEYNKERAINTERYGDCCEVNYELIFKDNIPRQRVREAIEKLKKACYCYDGEVDEYDTETIMFHNLIDKHLLKGLGLEE